MRSLDEDVIGIVIITNNIELCSVFASQTDFEIVGHFSSVKVAMNSSLCRNPHRIVLDTATDIEFKEVPLAKITEWGKELRIHILWGSSEDLQIKKNDLSHNLRIHSRPWDFTEIMNDLRMCEKNEMSSCEVTKSPEEKQYTDLSDLRSPDNQINRYIDKIEKCHDTNGRKNHTFNLNQGRIVTVINPKGGVGKTFFSINYACAITQASAGNTVLFDTNLGSGDMAIHLDMLSAKTISEFIPIIKDIDMSNIDRLIPDYKRVPLKVLLGPNSPEMCEFVEQKHLLHFLEVLSNRYENVIIDTPSNSFNPVTFDILERSSIIILVTTCELTALQQTRMSINIMKRLGIDVESTVKLILNKLDSASTISPGKIEDFLQLKIKGVIMDDPQVVNRSILNGVPVVINTKNIPMKNDLERVINSIHFNDNNFQSHEGKNAKRNVLSSLRSILFERRAKYD